jgi:hypothetical protein
MSYSVVVPKYTEALHEPVSKAKLPAPLVKPTKHPLRWAWHKVELTIAGLTFVHIGTLIVVALYFLITQNHLVKPLWDGLFHTAWWPTWRHMIRDVSEGLLGGTLGQMIIFNHYKPRNLKQKRNLIDKIEIALHIPNLKCKDRLSGWQYLAFIPLIFIYAIPGFFIGAGVVTLVEHSILHLHNAFNAFALNTHSHAIVANSTWARIQTVWTGDVSQKIVGLFASIIFARRVGKKYHDDFQKNFVERRIGLDKGVPFYWKVLPNWWARYNENHDNKQESMIAHFEKHRGGMVAWILSSTVFVGAILAGVGFYILTYVAA